MSEELQDEVTSINAIYGDDTLIFAEDKSDPIYTFCIPFWPSISFRLEFPDTYPEVPPSVLGTQSIGPDIPKGKGLEFVNIVRDVLADVYSPGVPCMFDLIETASEKLHVLNLSKAEGSELEQEEQAPQVTGIASSTGKDNFSAISDQQQQKSEGHALEIGGKEPPWILSDVVSEKKSIFIARSAPVASVTEAKTYVAHLITTDKKAAKATHNITAWRIRGENGVQFQDCDDDGETAAGGRLLHLLELMGVWNVMVIVTRWYGGVHLGPDRFRIINQVAREAVVRGAFASDKETSGGSGEKGKGKSK